MNIFYLSRTVNIFQPFLIVFFLYVINQYNTLPRKETGMYENRIKQIKLF